MQTNKKQSNYEGAEAEQDRAQAIQKAQAEYIQFWKSCKVDEGLIDQGPYVEMEESTVCRNCLLEYKTT